MSFGRHPPPKPETGIEESTTDAGVVPDGVGKLHDVGAAGLADLGHRVDERDLGGQKGIGRGLDQFRRGVVGHHQRDTVRQWRCVHLVEQGLGPLAVRAGRQPVDETIRVQGVLDGEPLTEELRVPGKQRAGLRLR